MPHWSSVATARGISVAQWNLRAWKYRPASLCCVFLHLRETLQGSYICPLRRGPASQNLEDAEKPCMRHCDHFSSFIFAEAMYLWLNLAQHVRSHWYTSKKWALLDQNRLKVWTRTSTVWTLRTVHSGRQLLLDKNQERTKCIFSISSFISSMANTFIPSEEKSFLDFYPKTCLGSKIWSGKFKQSSKLLNFIIKVNII